MISPTQKVGRIPTVQRHESETNHGMKIPIIVMPVSLEIAKPSTRLFANATIIIATAQPNKAETKERAMITEKESVDK